jgi:hypothetical protein
LRRTRIERESGRIMRRAAPTRQAASNRAAFAPALIPGIL